VQVIPSTARVTTGASAVFTASVSGTTNGRVSWTVDAGGGTIDPSGVYTAPAVPGEHRVRATSEADSNAFGEAVVTVRAQVRVSVSPTPWAVDACQTVQLTATVQNATNQAVSWRIQETGGGSVDTNGLYLAPAAAGTYHVVATSLEDQTASAAATITVSEKVLSVSVSPPSIQLYPGQSASFVATVRTTCGTTVTAKTITAPR
jgi:hypothetical protein